MVFKLIGETHHEVLNLEGSKLLDLSVQKRPMKEWVHVSFECCNQSRKFADKALK